MMLVYLSRPIDRLSGDTRAAFKELSDEVRSWLPGAVTYSPHSFDFPKLLPNPSNFPDRSIALKIRKINFAAIDQSDLFILDYVEGTPTWGCPVEMSRAADGRIPVVVLLRYGGAVAGLPTYIRAYVPDNHILIGPLDDRLEAIWKSHQLPAQLGLDGHPERTK